MSPPAADIDEYSSVVGRKNAPISRCHVIGSTNGAACPCCNTQRDCNRETLNEPSFIIPSKVSRQRNLIDDIEDNDADEDSSSDEQVDTLPGVLHSGVQYQPRRILVEGWVHKKGTGNDIFGSRAWKARYCRLVLAQVDGGDIDVPLLLLYWFPSSETPSTVITLESTVVVPLDRESKEDWTKYCFKVIHARGGSQTTRCFTAPQKGRDSWVFAINDALYNFEKTRSRSKLEMALHRQAAVISPLPKPPPEIVCSDTVVEMTMHSVTSPPSSPRSVPPRPPPRTDVLVGESFLLDL